MTRHHSNLTIKGQVTVPKDVRDALGLKPGEPVEFAWNDRGEAVIRRAQPDIEARAAKIRNDLRKFVGRFPDTQGRSTDEIMRELRGEDPFPP